MLLEGRVPTAQYYIQHFKKMAAGHHLEKNPLTGAWRVIHEPYPNVELVTPVAMNVEQAKSELGKLDQSVTGKKRKRPTKGIKACGKQKRRKTVVIQGDGKSTRQSVIIQGGEKPKRQSVIIQGGRKLTRQSVIIQGGEKPKRQSVIIQGGGKPKRGHSKHRHRRRQYRDNFS
jgi:hypothetical protein